MTFITDIRDLSFRREQYAENVARDTFDLLDVVTTGAGQKVMADPITFRAPYPERPYVLHGSEIVSGVNGGDLRVPMCSGSVFRWVRSGRGFYVGAYLAFLVDTNATDVVVRHSLLFTGVSYKDIAAGNEAMLTGAIEPFEVEL